MRRPHYAVARDQIARSECSNTTLKVRGVKAIRDIEPDPPLIDVRTMDQV
jgi:hypothetical protein